MPAKNQITSKTSGPKSRGSAPVVDSLATALRLLDFFTINEPELSLRQLSEKAGLYQQAAEKSSLKGDKVQNIYYIINYYLAF